MTKYKVSKAVKGELDEYKDNNEVITITDLLYGISYGSKGLHSWMVKINNMESRQREQAVIDYVFNGADNFEVKTPTWVIVSKHEYDEGGWLNLVLGNNDFINYWHAQEWTLKKTAIKRATRITDPKLKDALLYANKDFEAIEVEE